MRSRTGFTKRLLLSGATAFSLVGFASPAVFAMDGGNYGGYNNYSNGYSNSNYNYNGGNNYNCMMRSGNYNGWDGNYNNRYCMPHTTYSYSSYKNESRCDHQY